MQLRGEFYDLKSKLLESEEHRINDIEGKTLEEKTTNIIKWVMHNHASDKPKSSTSLDSKVLDTFKGTKHQKEARQQDAHKNLNKADQENSKRR